MPTHRSSASARCACVLRSKASPVLVLARIAIAKIETAMSFMAELSELQPTLPWTLAASCDGDHKRALFTSIYVNARALDHFVPFNALGAYKARELFRPHGEGVAADFVQGCRHFRERKGSLHFIGKLLDDRPGRAGGRKQSLPTRCLEARQGLADGRQIG